MRKKLIIITMMIMLGVLMTACQSKKSETSNPASEVITDSSVAEQNNNEQINNDSQDSMEGVNTLSVWLYDATTADFLITGIDPNVDPKLVTYQVLFGKNGEYSVMLNTLGQKDLQCAVWRTEDRTAAGEAQYTFEDNMVRFNVNMSSVDGFTFADTEKFSIFVDETGKGGPQLDFAKADVVKQDLNSSDVDTSDVTKTDENTPNQDTSNQDTSDKDSNTAKTGNAASTTLGSDNISFPVLYDDMIALGWTYSESRFVKDGNSFEPYSHQGSYTEGSDIDGISVYFGEDYVAQCSFSLNTGITANSSLADCEAVYGTQHMKTQYQNGTGGTETKYQFPYNDNNESLTVQFDDATGKMNFLKWSVGK